MRVAEALMGGLAAVLVAAGAAAAQERLVLEPYPPRPPANSPWRMVTDKDLGGRFYVELMPLDQTPADYRDILAAASFPHVKGSASDVLKAMIKQSEAAQPCDGLTVEEPRTSREQGFAVAYAHAFCGQLKGQTYGTQIFYKAIEGSDGIYVISRDFRVPPSKTGGAFVFAEGQQDQALALMTAIGAGNAWLSKSVYVCGAASSDPRCTAEAPSGTVMLVSGGELERVVNSTGYHRLVDKAVAALPAELTQGCGPVSTDRSSVMVLKPISFAPNGLPVDGAWKQSFPQTCRGGLVLNFLFTADAAQRIHTLLLEPGDGIAEPEVQAQAFRAAVASVRAASPACQALHVLDTRFEAFDHSKAPGPDPAPGEEVTVPWRETWTVGGCGSAWTVPMQFTPAGSTTQVAAGAAKPRP